MAAAASSKRELECAEDKIGCCVDMATPPLAGAASKRPSNVIGFTPKGAKAIPPVEGGKGTEGKVGRWKRDEGWKRDGKWVWSGL